MTIAIVTHNIVRGDGQGRVNYELVHYLLAHGHEVHCLCDRLAPDLVEAGAHWVELHPGFEQVDLLKTWRFIKLADHYLEEHADRYDIILACGATTTHPHSVNAVHFVHGTWLRSPYHAARVQTGVRGGYQWLFSTFNSSWELRAFAESQRIVAVSRMVAGELGSIGVDRSRIETIINGVDTDEFAPGPVRRSRLGLPENVPLALFVGDICSPIKNFDGVLRGLVSVPEVHLAVAGSTEKSPYPALARGLGLGDRVHFLGFRNDVPELMKGADWFVLPSRRDSCPLVMLEALASGLPVITATTVGTADIVTPEMGYVLNGPGDHLTLIRAMRELAQEPRRRREMGAAARALAERYHWDRMSGQYLRLFEELVAERRVLV